MAYNPRKRYSKAARKEAGRFSQKDFRALAKVARTKAATLWQKADAAEAAARKADAQAWAHEKDGNEKAAEAKRETAADYWQEKDRCTAEAQAAEADAAALEKEGGVTKARTPAPDF